MPDEARPKKRVWRMRDILFAVVAVSLIGGLVVARFFFAPYRIPSDSMAPTIVAGEYVLARNVTRQNGAPEINPGDVVFHSQDDEPGRTFVRRVLALPGQRIEFRDGAPIVDGIRAAQVDTGDIGPDGERIVRETLAGRSYLVAYRSDTRSPELRDMREIVVPEGTVFLVGDNRDNSYDSRLRGAEALASIRQVGGWIVISRDRSRLGARLE